MAEKAEMAENGFLSLPLSALSAFSALSASSYFLVFSYHFNAHG